MVERFFRFSFQRFLKISWTNQLDGPAGQTSWTDQLDGPAGRISSLYLKPWPVCIFKDWPFSLYIVTASESDEGLIFNWRLSLVCFYSRILCLVISLNISNTNYQQFFYVTSSFVTFICSLKFGHVVPLFAKHWILTCHTPLKMSGWHTQMEW